METAFCLSPCRNHAFERYTSTDSRPLSSESTYIPSTAASADAVIKKALPSDASAAASSGVIFVTEILQSSGESVDTVVLSRTRQAAIISRQAAAAMKALRYYTAKAS